MLVVVATNENDNVACDEVELVTKSVGVKKSFSIPESLLHETISMGGHSSPLSGRPPRIFNTVSCPLGTGAGSRCYKLIGAGELHELLSVAFRCEQRRGALRYPCEDRRRADPKEKKLR